MKKLSLLCLSLFCVGSLTACATTPSSSTAPAASVPAPASATPNQCASISGFYTGHYLDTTGLFPNKNFPINLYLTYQNGMVYGYTSAAGDKMGAGYGQKPYALIWGKCQNNAINDLHIIKNRQPLCGDPATTPSPLKANAALTLYLNYENAMINADLTATLTPSTSMLAQIVDQHLLKQAIHTAKTGVQTCH